MHLQDRFFRDNGGKLNFKHVEESSKTFFSRMVAAFPSASFQLVTGVIEEREMFVLRIASPSGDPKPSGVVVWN